MESLRRLLAYGRPVTFWFREPKVQPPHPEPDSESEPQRFDLKDVVLLRRPGRPLARVGQVLEDGRLRVWILKIQGGPQRWEGPKTVRATDVIRNFGPLDDVGIGAKIRDKT